MAQENEEVNVTEFGTETEFDGELEFVGKLVISGKFSGKISAAGDLEIAKTGTCTVSSIKARSIVVYGSVTGNLIAEERIEICKGATVIGNLETARLRIASNVNFEGQVSMLEKEPSVDLFSVASEEYKKSLVLKGDMLVSST